MDKRIFNLGDAPLPLDIDSYYEILVPDASSDTGYTSCKIKPADAVYSISKVYKALLRQEAEGAPLVSLLENGLAAAIVWTYGGSSGYYIGTLAGAFPQAKTFLMLQKDGGLATGLATKRDDYIKWLSVDTIGVYTTDDVSGKNSVLNYTAVLIEVYD